jgi:hypothetical protein
MDDTDVITAARANGWTTHPMFDRAGNEVAFVAQKGPEIHFQVRDGYKHRAMQRNRIRAFAQERMEPWGYLTTRVPHGRDEDHTFVMRCGFLPTWWDEHYTYFMMNELPFERAAKGN